MKLSPGARLGPYELTAAVGAGGMGEVHGARDVRLERTVAIKILVRATAPDGHDGLQREARAIAALNHPHVCALHDVGRENGTPFLVMEYVEGQTLATRLQRGALPPHEVIRYGIQIAEALDHATSMACSIATSSLRTSWSPGRASRCSTSGWRPCAPPRPPPCRSIARPPPAPA